MTEINSKGCNTNNSPCTQCSLHFLIHSSTELLVLGTCGTAGDALSVGVKEELAQQQGITQAEVHAQ